jgi:predicted GNAT family N-acyltransferase
MKTQTSNAAIPVLLSTVATKTFTFREITDAAELEEAFRLRYEVYSRSKNHGFVKQTEARIDLEIFDLHSRHYGLYSVNNELAGYLRVVLDRKEYYNSSVFEVGEKIGLFSVQEHSEGCLKKSMSPDFPFLSYKELPACIRLYYQSIRNRNEGIAEAGRIIIKEEYRGIRTSAFMVECALVLYMLYCQGSKHAVISCLKEHSLFYLRYGFQPMGDGQPYHPFGTTSVILGLPLATELSQSKIPLSFHARLEEMTAMFNITGQIQRIIN